MPKKAPKEKKPARTPKGKPAVIVESPAKARTIERILGGEFVVRSSMGHVRDLPQRRFGIDLDKDFAPTYVPIKAKAKVVRDLKSAVRSASTVFLATDPDREGEAIAWHLAEILGLAQDRTRRVTFHEITKRAVQDAFKEPRGISMALVHAQQARRLLDRIVGYKLSPLLWKKVGRGLSAGRVQSVAVRLIVEREREVVKFKPVEYWRLTATVSPSRASQTFAAELVSLDGAPAPKEEREAEDDAAPEAAPLVRSGDEARALKAELEPGPWTVGQVKKRQRTDRTLWPFTTSLLQQQASIRLYFSTRRTMAIAQQLYEGVDIGEEGTVGLITYMRTDSYKVAADAVTACRDFIAGKYGREYLPETPPTRAAAKHAQEAHEAIRPTDVTRTPERLKNHLTSEQYRLYRLIWERFVASQMNPARYMVTEVLVRSGRGTFRTTGRVMEFDGASRVWSSKEKDEPILPDVAEGQALDLKSLDATQHFTEPPPRYTEAALVKALEKFGIGRPSTYAPIIGTVQDRGYVQMQDRKLMPTDLGKLVTEKLVEHFGDIMDTGFTASMEEKLDRIEEADDTWTQVLREFYGVFQKDLDSATASMESEKALPAEGEAPCGECGRPMVWRWNRFGKFLGCSGFPECKGTRTAKEDLTDKKCPRCSNTLRIRRNKMGRYLSCLGWPACKYTRPLEYRGRPIRMPEDWNEACAESKHPLILRIGRRGPFIACTGYPDCKYTRNMPKEWTAPPGDGAAQGTATGRD